MNPASSSPSNPLATVRVPLGDRAYDIRVGRGVLPALATEVASLARGRRVALVTNPDLDALHGARVRDALASAGLAVETIAIPEGESHKNVAAVSHIWDRLVEGRHDRGTTVVALGGGVVGDVAGFAAATFLRGVDLVQLPTSLLAMVDSSVGGKTGVNHPLGKNLLGAFKQPRLVGIDIGFLATLSEAEFVSGLAEVLKYGAIFDEPFLAWLEASREAVLARDPDALVRVVVRSCEIKAHVVGEDEEERGLRAILNFGHTFAHAVETLTEYRGPRHGEAVAMGMVAACRLGEAVGCFRAADTARLRDAIAAYGLPTALPRFDPDDYVRVMRSDKKTRGGRLRFVVPTAIGEVEVREIDESVARAALEASFEPASSSGGAAIIA